MNSRVLPVGRVVVSPNARDWNPERLYGVDALGLILVVGQVLQPVLIQLDSDRWPLSSANQLMEISISILSNQLTFFFGFFFLFFLLPVEAPP